VPEDPLSGGPAYPPSGYHPRADDSIRASLSKSLVSTCDLACTGFHPVGVHFTGTTAHFSCGALGSSAWGRSESPSKRQLSEDLWEN
jgi:hypothetical protein